MGRGGRNSNSVSLQRVTKVHEGNAEDGEWRDMESPGIRGFAVLRTIVVVAALEKEEGGEVLPGERTIGGEGNMAAFDLEATLLDQLFKSGVRILIEVPTKLFIHGSEET